jgi:hypothetical protein
VRGLAEKMCGFGRKGLIILPLLAGTPTTEKKTITAMNAAPCGHTAVEVGSTVQMIAELITVIVLCL